jgi:regulator of sigma E protease
MELLHTVVSFLVAICVLVAVHEFGHYWVARRLGVKVLRFSIGFGPALKSWRGRDADRVEYVVAAIPLGGYVKMLDETEGTVADAERGRAFNRQTLAVRSAVVAAGPLFNFAFAVLAYWAMFVVGIDGLKPVVGPVAQTSIAARAGLRGGDEVVAVGGRAVSTWQGVVEALLGGSVGGVPVDLGVRAEDGTRRVVRIDLAAVPVDDLARGKLFETLGFEPRRPLIPAVLGQIEPGSPAGTAGLRSGDRVLSAAGEPLAGWGAFVEAVRASPGRLLALEVERDGVRIGVGVLPESIEGPDGIHGRIGAGVRQPGDSLAAHYATERYGVLEALERGATKTAEMSLLTVRFLWKMLLGEVSVKNLSGPISIAQYAGLSADDGVARFLDFLGIVSISLGILNLLPVPVLDGGHLLYYLIELVRGKPLSEEAQFIGQRLGIAMLVGLMGLAFYNDLSRLFG